MMPAIHTKYIYTALGEQLSGAALKVVKTGVEKSDAVHNHLIPQQHVTRNPDEGVEFIGRVGNYVLKTLKDASEKLEAMKDGETPQLRDEFDKTVAKGLYGIGRFFHAVHDAASHWDILLKHPETRKDGFAEILQGKKPVPPDVMACKGVTFPQEWLKVSGWYILRHIMPDGVLKKALGKTIKKMYENPDARERTHFSVNLDRNGTPGDWYYKIFEGKSGFEMASSVSVGHTKDMFHENFREGLAHEIGTEKAFRLFNALTTWKPKNKTVLMNADKIGEDSLLPEIEGFITNRRKFDSLRSIENFKFGDMVRGFRRSKELPSNKYFDELRGITTQSAKIG